MESLPEKLSQGFKNVKMVLIDVSEAVPGKREADELVWWTYAFSTMRNPHECTISPKILTNGCLTSSCSITSVSLPYVLGSALSCYCYGFKIVEFLANIFLSSLIWKGHGIRTESSVTIWVPPASDVFVTATIFWVLYHWSMMMPSFIHFWTKLVLEHMDIKSWSVPFSQMAGLGVSFGRWTGKFCYRLDDSLPFGNFLRLLSLPCSSSIFCFSGSHFYSLSFCVKSPPKAVKPCSSPKDVESCFLSFLTSSKLLPKI